MSGIPSKNSCIIYFIKIADAYKANVSQSSIVSSLDYNETLEYLDSVGVIDMQALLFINNNNGSITLEHTHVALRNNSNHTGKVYHIM